MSSPFFSVIVPVYNVEKYLHECVDSILNQSFTDFEVILVDDGSPDNCPQICDQYAQKDSRVKVIHKPNGGLSSARNKGINLSLGEYILFCDGDDYYLSGAFEKIHSKLNSVDCDILNFGYIKELTENGFTEHCKLQELYLCNVTQSMIVELAFVGLLQRHDKYHIEAWANAFRREFLQDNALLYIEELKRNEDLIHLVNAYTYARRILYISDEMYFYRFNPKSIMNSFRYTETTIANSIKYLKCLLEILQRAVDDSSKYTYLFNKSLLRVALNPCIANARSMKNIFVGRRKYIKEVLGWYKKSLEKCDLKIHKPVGLLNKFECFLVTKDLYFLINLYTFVLAVYEKMKRYR